HPCTAAALVNLASAHREQREYEPAEALYRRALAVEEKTLGPETAEVFKTLANLAYTYYQQRRYEDAELFYIRSLKIAETSVGAAHPEAIVALDNYGEVLRKLHRKAEAKKVEARVRELRARSGEENPGKYAVDWRELKPSGGAIVPP